MYTNRSTVATLMGQYISIANKMGMSPVIASATTINTKRGIAADTHAVSTDTIGLFYFGIGISGSSATTTEYSQVPFPTLTPYTPSEENMDLYYPIPILVIPSTDNTTDRTLYRMLDQATLPGYDVYWLKKAEFDDSITMETISEAGVREPYVYTTTNGVPDKLTPAHDDDESPNIVVGVKLNCVLTGAELEGTIAQYLGGHRDLACISEYGLYSGVDYGVDPDIEAIDVQLAVHRCLRGHDLSSPNAQVTESFIIESSNSLVTRTFG